MASIHNEGPHVEEEIRSHEMSVTEKHNDFGKEKETEVHELPIQPAYSDPEDLSFGKIGVLENAEDIVTHVIHVDDDPTLSPWTFRMFFIGKLALLYRPLDEILHTPGPKCID